MITIRYRASVIQKIGCRFKRRSRSVPPPIAVMAAMTTTPRRSSPLLRAASTPLTAKTATPPRSRVWRIIGRPAMPNAWRVSGRRWTDRSLHTLSCRPAQAACSAPRLEIPDSVVVRSTEPCAMYLVDLKDSLYLEFVLHVEQHPHSRLKTVAVSIDVPSRARNMEPEAAVRVCLIGICIDPRDRVLHAVRQCAERVAAERPALTGSPSASGSAPDRSSRLLGCVGSGTRSL